MTASERRASDTASQPDNESVPAIYRWTAGGKEHARIIIAHGLAEHGARYQPVGETLAAAGFTVIAYDQRGHGPGADKLGDFGENGWRAMLDDLALVLKEEGGEKTFLLGHSMGSMLAHHFATLHGERLDGLILSGSPGLPSALQRSLLLTASRFERWRLGPQAVSPLLRFLLFGRANRGFEAEGDTGFEWLSRDAEQVSRYVSDPLCGFTPTTGSVVSWFDGYGDSLGEEAIASLPAELPVYLFSGADDPVHEGLKGIDRQLAAYRAQGLCVDSHIYTGGRHEMFNELNRDEVLADLIAWLKWQCGEAAAPGPQAGPAAEA